MPAEPGGTPIPTEELGAPAGRALDDAGITTLEQLAELPAADVGELHGVGPSALDTLREALDANGMSFREDA